MGCKSGVLFCVLGSLGVAMLIAGCALIHFQPTIIKNNIDDGVVISKGSAGYDNWKNPKSPVYFQIWAFHVNNSEAVQNGKEKPVLVQMGPYTYKENKTKFNVTFQNGTVDYMQATTYVFVPEMSSGLQNDTFTTINIPYLIAVYLTETHPWLAKAIDFVLKFVKETPFKTFSVQDLIWGYHDPIFAVLSKVVPTVPPEFGLFYGSNGTAKDTFEVNTGEKDVRLLGEIVAYDGQRQLNYWTSPSANSINGTDGTMYSPFIDKNQTKYLFSSDVCRSLGLDFTESISHRGIDMDRFVAPDSLFANATLNPDNAGFCTPKENCLPSGLLNVSNCRGGAPIVLSMPHFLGCDDDIIDSVTGLHPKQEAHQSYLDIEPMTGVVMAVGKRLQINVPLHPVPAYPEAKNLKKMFLPVVWFNESALIDQEDADKFKSGVYTKIHILTDVKYSLIGVGAFVMLAVIAVLAVVTVRKRSGRVLVNTRDDDLAPIVT